MGGNLGVARHREFWGPVHRRREDAEVRGGEYSEGRGPGRGLDQTCQASYPVTGHS